MKELERKLIRRINLVPTMEMVTEARERVARALEVTQEHRLESQLSGIPIESKLQK